MVIGIWNGTPCSSAWPSSETGYLYRHVPTTRGRMLRDPLRQHRVPRRDDRGRLRRYQPPSPPACNETGSRGGGPRAWTPTAPRRRSGCSWYQRSTRVEVEHEVVLVPRRGSIEVAPGAAHELTQGPVGLGQDDPEML